MFRTGKQQGQMMANKHCDAQTHLCTLAYFFRHIPLPFSLLCPTFSSSFATTQICWFYVLNGANSLSSSNSWQFQGHYQLPENCDCDDDDGDYDDDDDDDGDRDEDGDASNYTD